MPLTPTMRPDNGCPLDLSYSMLRSVSPVHLAYLANMGVRASMSISLIVGGRLWGLISSGHRAPLRLPYRLHSTCETIGRLVSLQIGALQAPCVLWFRPELIHSVTWAGNPQLPSGDEAMLGLNPNRSFEMWKALVHDQSAAWARAELDAAADLRRSAIEIDLARQVAKEKAAVQARDELVAVVSHDLRTPLSVVVMQSVILQRLIALEPVESSQRIKTSAQIIQRSAERMNAMLQDLLDLAKIEAGRFEIRRSDQSAALILEEAFELLQSLAAAKRIKLVAAQTAVDTIRVDPERVFQVLSNLIGNAIKFSPEGGQVSLGAGRVGQMCEFRIADEGIGIAPDQLSRIFDRYWQAKQSDAMGAGLGLYIARGIVEAHGGTIRAESVLGRGTTFFFTVPFA